MNIFGALLFVFQADDRQPLVYKRLRLFQVNIFGALLFAFLTVVRLAQIFRNGVDLPGVLLAIQAGMVVFLIVYRRPASQAARPNVQALARLSAIVPLAMQTSEDASMSGWLSVPGLLMMLWALWSLGTSFSISPAARKLVLRGPYRFIRHPMYAGEIFSLLGLCVGSPLLWNWIVLMVFALSIWYRISQEESLLKRYSVYAYFVKWRLLPGVW